MRIILYAVAGATAAATNFVIFTGFVKLLHLNYLWACAAGRCANIIDCRTFTVLSAVFPNRE